MATALDLEPHDRLTYLIGQAVQADVAMDRWARRVWAQLAGGTEGLAKFVVPPRLATVIDDSITMLERSALDEPVKAAGAEVLKLARAAHAARNENAHRFWYAKPDPDDPRVFRTQRLHKRRVGGDRTPRNIKEVETTVLELTAAAARLLDLFTHLLAPDEETLEVLLGIQPSDP